MTSAVDHLAKDGPSKDDTHAVIGTQYDISGTGLAEGWLLEECRAYQPRFSQVVSAAAQAANVDSRALGVRTLLHLPRVATYRGRVTRTQVERELSRCGRLLSKDIKAVEHLVPRGTFALEELVFAEKVDPVVASNIFSSLHYLRSARLEAENFALLDPVNGRPVTICSVSPLEWKRVGNQINAQFGIRPEGIWDVSRVYSCTAAPPNAISFMLSRVRNSLSRSGRGIRLLVTTVDPNLGFTGASYRAANWQQWLTVQPRPYLYHNYRYASPRQLRQRFGTSNLSELQAEFPRHYFERSQAKLADSLIFCCDINRQTQVVPVSRQRRLHR